MDDPAMIPPVFLSASEPNPRRKPEYWDSRNLLNVREAVRTFCAYALPHYPVVFGGHPAITPLVRQVAARTAHQAETQAGTGVKAARWPRILMFQSSLYVDRLESKEEIFTPAHEADGRLAGPTSGMRNASLLRMRYEMLGTPDSRPVHPLLDNYVEQFGRRREALLKTYEFSAAIFIGGMEGVEREFRIFRSFHPHTPAYPIGSTGSVCIELLNQIRPYLTPEIFEALRDETAYNLLMQQILPIPSGPDAATAGRWKMDLTPAYDPGTHIDPKEIDRPRPAVR
jgi:hypothetical protein